MLVVDDDNDNRRLLVELLESEGYSATGVENGSRAQALLAEGLDPDLILTDLQMPVMSGWDLCDYVKEDPRLRSIPIVLLCGMAGQPGVQLKVDGVFQKPADPSKLLTRIAELCGI